MQKNFLRRLVVVLASQLAVSVTAQASDFYAGVGLPGLFTLGVTETMTGSTNLRMDLASGISLTKDAVFEGVSAIASVKSSVLGFYGDWYPFSASEFRLVGGLTINDIKAELTANPKGFVNINGVAVNMTGEYYQVNVAMPTLTPYVGIGIGHRATKKDFGFYKGVGFFADLGLILGSFTVNSSTSLVSKGKLAQADVNAQEQKIRDSLSSFSFLPVVSVGLVYKF
jgi:hypothetical protein